MFTPTPDEARALGSVLRGMREGAELTLRETAERVGVTHTTLSRFEHGTRVVSAETLARICRVIADEVIAKRRAAA